MIRVLLADDHTIVREGVRLCLEAMGDIAVVAEGGRLFVGPDNGLLAPAWEALDADPQLTWMVGDDIESDIAGAQTMNMRTVLVRTGKFRPDEVEAARVRPDGIVSSIGALPDWLEEHL